MRAAEDKPAVIIEMEEKKGDDDDCADNVYYNVEENGEDGDCSCSSDSEEDGAEEHYASPNKEIKRVSGGIAAAAATALAAATIGDDAATKKQKIEEAYKQNLTKFAEAIINRQKEAVEKMLRTDSTLLTTPVDLTDLDGGKIAKELKGKEKLAPIDLAASLADSTFLKFILTIGLECVDQFSLHLSSSELEYPGEIMAGIMSLGARARGSRLQLAQDLLDARVARASLFPGEKEKEGGECTLTRREEDEDLVQLDLSPFLRRRGRFDETTVIVEMLGKGDRQLIRHPVTEAFIRLKWRRIRSFILVCLAYRLCLAAVASATLLSSPYSSSLLRWALLALAIPLAFSAAASGLLLLLRQRSGQIEFPPLVSSRGPFSILFLEVGLLSCAICQCCLIEQEGEAGKVVRVWTMLLSWTYLLVKVADWPAFGIYPHALFHTMINVGKFLAATLPLYVAFAVYYYASQTPALHSALTVPALLVGRVAESVNSEEKAHSVVVAIIALLALSVLAFGVAIGIAVVSVAETLARGDDFEIDKMVSNAFNVERVMKCLHFLPCLRNFTFGRLFYHADEDCKVAVSCETSIRPRRSKKVFAIRSDGAGARLQVPERVMSSAVQLLERAELAEKLAGEGEAAGTAMERDEKTPDYMSLYWGQGGKQRSLDGSEGLYEIVDDGGRYADLRMIRERLLGEIKRDFHKLVGGNGGKSVNVRPGLALGVITLRAGGGGQQQQQKITLDSAV